MPRLFVRARWTLADANVFLMTAWFRADAAPSERAPSESSQAESARPELVLLSADSSWSKDMRDGKAPLSLGERLDFQFILNEFDADQDGWAELLVYSRQGAATVLGLYLYSDQGLVPMNATLRRDPESADACLDP